MRTTTYCTNLDAHDVECMQPLPEGVPVSLCQTHLLLAAEHVRDLDDDAARRVTGRPINANKPRIKHHKLQVVYYLRRGECIKIGTSTNLHQRMADLRGDVLLAIEQGGHNVERSRHHTFAETRVEGEWFRMTQPLVDHIRKVRADNGAPLEAWQRWVDAWPA